MMTGKIHMGQSLRALHHYFEVYNHGKSLKHQIRGSVLHTAERLLKIYIKYHQEGKADNFTFQTNNASLAEATFRSADTIIRHIKKLVEAGIILFKTRSILPDNPRYWFNYTVCLNEKIVVFKYLLNNRLVDNPIKPVDKLPEDVNKLVDKAKRGVDKQHVQELTPELKSLKEKALGFFYFSNCRNLRHIRLLELLEPLELLEHNVDKDRKIFFVIDLFQEAQKKFILNWNKTRTSLQVSLAGTVDVFQKKKGSSGWLDRQKKALAECFRRVINSQEFLKSCASALLSTSSKLLDKIDLSNTSLRNISSVNT